MEEIKVLVDNYDSQHNLASTGFHLGGQKYFYLRWCRERQNLILPLGPRDSSRIYQYRKCRCSGNDDVVRGKQGKGGVHVVKTNQVLKVWDTSSKPKIFSHAVILGLYEEPMQPAEAATVTETLGDYLKGVGYWLSQFCSYASQSSCF